MSEGTHSWFYLSRKFCLGVGGGGGGGKLSNMDHMALRGGGGGGDVPLLCMQRATIFANGAQRPVKASFPQIEVGIFADPGILKRGGGGGGGGGLAAIFL